MYVINDPSNQPVLVPADIENRAVSNKVHRPIICLNITRHRPVSVFNMLIPSLQRSFSVRANLPEFTESRLRYDPHLYRPLMGLYFAKCESTTAKFAFCESSCGFMLLKLSETACLNALGGRRGGKGVRCQDPFFGEQKVPDGQEPCGSPASNCKSSSAIRS
jgi:hypothetical protein